MITTYRWYPTVQKLDRYIFKQLSLIFVFFLFVFTLIFWINRVIGLFDRLITDGHSSSTLFQFALLSLPSITTIVFPLACFAAVIFVTNRLKIDSEFTVLQSAGLSPWRLNKPYFIFGILCMLILGVFTTFVVPNTAKILHEKQLELDSSVSARLLKGGKFIHPFKGVTFYIKEIESEENPSIAATKQNIGLWSLLCSSSSIEPAEALVAVATSCLFLINNQVETCER